LALATGLFKLLRNPEVEEATQPTYEHSDGNCDVLDTLCERLKIFDAHPIEPYLIEARDRRRRLGNGEWSSQTFRPIGHYKDQDIRSFVLNLESRAPTMRVGRRRVEAGRSSAYGTFRT